MESTIISHAIRDFLGQIHLNVLEDLSRSKGRSGSQPHRHSSPKAKDYDLMSLTTVAGTHQSHGSAKKVGEFSPDRQSQSFHHEKTVNQNFSPKESGDQNSESNSKWKLSKVGTLLSSINDISHIKYYFIKVANDKQMMIVRDLDNVVTVKSIKGHSVGCLFKLCFPLGWDRSVYQLERSFSGKGSRVRITLVAGVTAPSKQKQLQFEAFKKQFYFQLWENSLLDLDDSEAINLCCSVNQEFISYAKKVYEKAYSQCQIFNLESAEEIQKWECGLMNTFKKAEKRTYDMVFQGFRRIAKDRENIDYFHRHFLSLVPVEEFYIRSKLTQNKKIEQIRRQVQATSTIGDIFRFLEVQDLFLPFIRQQKDKILGEIIDQSDIPFLGAIKALEELAFGVSPLKNIEVISRFAGSLVAHYRNFCEWEQPVLNMDNQLPLSIYCILACQNTQLKAIVSLCGSYLQFEETCENEKRTLAALNASLDFIYAEWPLRR